MHLNIVLKDVNSAATRTASSGKNVKDLFHVAISGGCCLLWIAPALTRVQIGRMRPTSDVRRVSSRSGRGALPSRGGALPRLQRPWSVVGSNSTRGRKPRLNLLSGQPFPSGSSNEANE